MNLPAKAFRRKRAVQRDIDALLATLRSASEVGLHLGCGPDLIPGMINCDAFHPAADRKIGATDLSEFADESIDFIETHHMIEHLSFAEAELAFGEWCRVLRRGGHVAITCPDFGEIVERWRKSPREMNWSSTIKMVYGSQEHEGMFHRSGYDAAHLASLLEAVGLQEVFHYTPYPRRPTPSLFMLAQKS